MALLPDDEFEETNSSYLKALDVFENTVRIAFLIFGVSRNTARATRTMSITYSTIVCPVSSLTRSRLVSAASILVSILDLLSNLVWMLEPCLATLLIAETNWEVVNQASRIVK